jgi:hypothetical protein
LWARNRWSRRTSGWTLTEGRASLRGRSRSGTCELRLLRAHGLRRQRSRTT